MAGGKIKIFILNSGKQNGVLWLRIQNGERLMNFFGLLNENVLLKFDTIF